MKRKFLLLLLLVLIAVLAAGCGRASGPLLTQLAVYGESALLESEGNALTAYTLADTKSDASYAILTGGTADTGMYLPQLLPGKYLILLGEEALITTYSFEPLEGYTLPREGLRNHWLFAADKKGRLTLTVEQTEALPAGFCDVFIDIGHGGKDTGAAAWGYIEAEENLRSGMLLGEQFSQMGLTVTYSRTDANISGGSPAEHNPYYYDARIDRVYASRACYLISNHLNGGDGRESGWQIYSSVQASTAWADAIAAQWLALGHSANNCNTGLVKDGIYNRISLEAPTKGLDYYFILRETGGETTTPYYYRRVRGGDLPELRKAPAGLLLEYLFLDNRKDMEYWEANMEELVKAAAEGCRQYWQL